MRKSRIYYFPECFFLRGFYGLIALIFLLEYFNRYFVGYPGERFTIELREKLFEHQLHLALEDKIGDLNANVTAGQRKILIKNGH